MKASFRVSIRHSVLILLAGSVFGSGMLSYASAPSDDKSLHVDDQPSGFYTLLSPGRETVRPTMMTLLQDGKIDTASLTYKAALQKFYTDHDGQTVWINGRANHHERVEAVLGLLDESWTQALNPKNYHVEQIRALLHATTPEEKAKLELLVADAVLGYGHDMTGMHLSAASLRQDPQFWRKPLDSDTILQSITTGNALDFLKGLTPTDPLYTALRTELIALVKDSARTADQYIPIALGRGTFLPGKVSRDVPKLRGRLGLPAAAKEQENIYDDTLAEAVMTFQQQHGLVADGHIGPKTLAFLNRSTAQKMNQIVANMERLRWLDQKKPDRYIMVNIPAQRLWAMDHGKAALNMPVIVGRPERPTKSFVTQILGVRFNPKWTVPPTVKSNDFLPKLIQDPTFLAAKGIDVSYVVDGHRQVINSTQVNWAQVTKADLMRLHMVQNAGDDNALGKVRVLMDNPYDIYLHDTSNHSYFSKSERLLSSGCVRLSDPEAVARFILTSNQGWSDDKMKSIINSGRTTEIAAVEKIPVYILYQTIWLGDDGKLVYGSDVYGQDKTLINTLLQQSAYALPEPEKVKFASIGDNAPVQ